MPFSGFFARWLGRATPVRDDLHVILYTRRGCHLCEDAWEILEPFQRRYGFRLDTQDVDTAPDLVAAYGECVPVVTVNGKVRFRGRVNRVLMQRLLDAGPASRGA
jgi:glutaredoxin